MTTSMVEPAQSSRTRSSDAVAARRWLEAHGFPSTTEEAWLNTPVAEITARLAESSLARPHPLLAATIDELAGRHSETRIVMVNGVHSLALSDPDPPQPGVRFGSAATATHTVADFATTPWRDPVDGFDALSRASAQDFPSVRVERGTAVDGPIHIVHVAAPAADHTVSHPRLTIDACAGSAVKIIESHVGLRGGAITNASTSILLGQDAEVVHHRVQNEADDAIHLCRLTYRMDRGARVRSTGVTRGADISRLSIDVALTGDGGSCDLDGLYLATGRQRHDTVVTVDHAASDCTSAERFKGLVDQRGRASFTGHVIVRPGTVETTAHQTNRNLLLAETAQANSRPWLEIFADDVRCNHGSATGRLDEDALFYLRSRGIPRRHARHMLIEAYARDITDHVEPLSLREELGNLVRQGLT